MAQLAIHQTLAMPDYLLDYPHTHCSYPQRDGQAELN